MAEAELMERPGRQLRVGSLNSPLARSRVLRRDPTLVSQLPGELACADEWHEIAKLLDVVAASIPMRMRGHGAFSAALARFIAREVRGTAAEIRANLALEERDACIKASSEVRRHG